MLQDILRRHRGPNTYNSPLYPINTYRQKTHSYFFLPQQTKRSDSSRRFSSVGKIDLNFSKYCSDGGVSLFRINFPGSVFFAKFQAVCCPLSIAADTVSPANFAALERSCLRNDSREIRFILLPCHRYAILYVLLKYLQSTV